MDMNLTAEEAELLKKILQRYVSDLKMEISNTEKYEWRQEMKQDEETVKGLITRLGS